MEVAQTCWSSPGGRCLELLLGPRLRRGWRLVGEGDTAARESGFPPGNVAQCVLWWKVPSRGITTVLLCTESFLLGGLGQQILKWSLLLLLSTFFPL